MYAPSGAVITQFLFSFPVPGGFGVGVGREKLALIFLLQWDGRWLGDSFAGFNTCRLSFFVWCSYAMNDLYRVLGGDGDGG